MNEQECPAEGSFDSKPSKPAEAESAKRDASNPVAEDVVGSPDSVRKIRGWLSKLAPWGSAKGRAMQVADVPTVASESTFPVVLEATTAATMEPSVGDFAGDPRATVVLFTGLSTVPTDVISSTTPGSVATIETSEIAEDRAEKPEGQGLDVVPSANQIRIIQSRVEQLGAAGAAALDAARSAVASSLTSAIRMVSSERDRDEIIRWLVKVRGILARDSSTAEKTKELYRSVDTVRFAKLLANTVATSVTSYQNAKLPLALKVALPVTAVGAGFFGAQSAGLAAFGSAIGVPVLLLLFLGTAGATAVIQAFVGDRNVRDPLTRLLLTFVAFETARRAKKDLLEAMRADAMVPERAEVPEDEAALLDFLMTMDPIAFERHVMSFFEKSGYPTGLTPRTNDFGVDGYVFHPDGIIVVQCKRYGVAHPVGRPVIQQFKGVIEEQQAYRGYFVTTSRFTEEATNRAAMSDRLLLVDGVELIRWHKEGWKLK